MKYFLSTFTICLIWIASSAQATDKIIRIYQDADLSHHKESSHAIQMGIEQAFSEINNEIDGYKVEFKYLDHRGNVIRSKKNYETFINDPQALAIYSGIHSPPLIKNRTFINENKALTLVPWAAGGPITRYPSPNNWIFRLSIDDMRAGPIIIDYAMKQQNCQRPHLLLENTPWGESNLKNMSKALQKHNIFTPNVTRFGWNIKKQSVRTILRKIIENEHDCIILVANAIESTLVALELYEMNAQHDISLISHWGINAGDFQDKVSVEKRNELNLAFIQSCFAFTNKQQTDFSNKVFSNLKTHNENIKNPKDLKSAVGFIHAYDLTKILITAIKQAGLTGDINQDRKAVRLALENLNTPVQGLIKKYEKPFSVFHKTNNINAHEALHSSDYCMARYGMDNEVLIIDTK
jgi:branched-chain amino acid transport system substrate-binding protein